MPIRSPRQLALDLLAVIERAWGNPRVVDQVGAAADDAAALIAQHEADTIRNAMRQARNDWPSPRTVTGPVRAGIVCAAELRIDRVTVVGLGRARPATIEGPATAVDLQAVQAGGCALR